MGRAKVPMPVSRAEGGQLRLAQEDGNRLGLGGVYFRAGGDGRRRLTLVPPRAAEPPAWPRVPRPRC